MGLHYVKITELKTTVIPVYADYDFEALHQVEKDYAEGIINLYDEDLADFKIEIVEEM